MSAYAGSLVPVTTPYVSLDRIPLVLLLGALAIAFSRGRLDARRRHSIALVSIGMALGLLAVHVVQLAMLDPARRVLRDVTTNLVRIGSFDANLGFFVDPAAAFLLLLPLVGSAFFLAQTKFVEGNETANGRFQSSVLLLCAGVSTALLADGFVALLMGLSLAIVATYLLIVRDEHLRNAVTAAGRVFLVQSAGSASFLAGFVLLFWSLGGAWHQDGYLGDYHARFVAVHDRAHPAEPEETIVPEETARGERDAALVAQRAKERGSLTFTSYPGAHLFVDVGDKNLDHVEPFATAPFVRKELSVGPHDVVIVPEGAAIVSGDGHEVGWIDRLLVGKGEDVAIVPIGQTTTFSEIEEQLGLVDEDGKHFLRNALFNNQITESFSIVSLLVFLFGLGSILIGAPLVAVPWISRAASSSTWNVLRISGVVLALYPLVRFRSFIEFHYEMLAILFVAAAVITAIVRARGASLLLGAATIVAAVFFVPTNAYASPNGEARMVLRAEHGDVVELDYAPDGETMVGAFVIRNDGTGPLQVSRAALRGNTTAQQSPPFTTVEIDGSKGQPVVIEPGKERRAIIRWQYASARAREFYGLAYAELYDTRVENVVPVHAARSRDLGPFGDRALSFVVWFPLLASVLAIALRLLRRATPRFLAASTALVFTIHLIFVAVVGFRFDKAFAHADGNDGYQLIERSVLTTTGAGEYFLGLDGVSLLLVITVSIAALLASIASLSLRNRAIAFHVIAPIFVTSVLGVFLSLDLFLVCAFWFVGVIASTWLIAYRGTPGTRRAALQFGALSFAGMFFIAAAAIWLYTHSDTAYLVNGRFVQNSLAIPDLARVNWVSVDVTLLGAKGITVVWSAFFVAFVLRLVTWANVFVESDGPTNMLVPAALVGTGIWGLLRFNLGVLPQGTQWAATTTIAVGVMMVIVFAFMARFQTNMKRWMAHGATAYAGFALIGFGSCTPEGIAAMLHVAVSFALAIGLFAMLAQTLETRVQTVDMTRLRGLSEDMPLFAGFFLIAIFVLLGLPGLVGFWGPLLAIVGVVPRHVPLAMLAIASGIILGATNMQIAGQILFGSVDAKWRKSKELAASGGKFPDLLRNEMLVLVPLAVLVIGLGLSPRTLFSVLDAVILDLHRLVDAAGAMQVG